MNAFKTYLQKKDELSSTILFFLFQVSGRCRISTL